MLPAAAAVRVRGQALYWGGAVLVVMVHTHLLRLLTGLTERALAVAVAVRIILKAERVVVER